MIGVSLLLIVNPLDYTYSWWQLPMPERWTIYLESWVFGPGEISLHRRVGSWRPSSTTWVITQPCLCNKALIKNFAHWNSGEHPRLAIFHAYCHINDVRAKHPWGHGTFAFGNPLRFYPMCVFLWLVLILLLVFLCCNKTNYKYSAFLNSVSYSCEL